MRASRGRGQPGRGRRREDQIDQRWPVRGRPTAKQGLTSLLDPDTEILGTPEGLVAVVADTMLLARADGEGRTSSEVEVEVGGKKTVAVGLVRPACFPARPCSSSPETHPHLLESNASDQRRSSCPSWTATDLLAAHPDLNLRVPCRRAIGGPPTSPCQLELDLCLSPSCPSSD